MNDIFYYNSGTLLQALHPSDTLVDLSNEPFIDNIAEAFIPTVSQNGGTFGVPVGFASGGGILYNKKIYEQLGLSIPTTWAEFEANNETIKAAGIAPVLQTFGDTWTAQLFVLADMYNVAQASPNFAEDYTNNKAKYADSPKSMAGFAHLQEGFEKGWYQQDFATTLFPQGMELIANGEVAQWAMGTFVMPAIAANYPDKVNDLGYFGMPALPPLAQRCGCHSRSMPLRRPNTLTRLKVSLLLLPLQTVWMQSMPLFYHQDHISSKAQPSPMMSPRL